MHNETNKEKIADELNNLFNTPTISEDPKKKKGRSRKTSKLPTRIYKYGLSFGPLPESQEVVEQQFRLARKFKNQLTEIIQARRWAYRRLCKQFSDLSSLYSDLDALFAKVNLLEGVIGLYKSKNYTNNDKEVKEVKTEIERLKKLQKTTYTKLSSLRNKKKKEDPVFAEELTALDDRFKTMSKACRRQISKEGLHWGTYNKVEGGQNQADKSPTGPQFSRWDGSGQIAVQLQSKQFKDRSPRILGNNTFVQVHQQENQPEKFKTLRLRVGSEGRTPVWVSFKMVMHRSLPETCAITWVYVTRKREGAGFKWEACFVVEDASFFSKERNDCGTLAIDRGWRMMDDGSARLGVGVANDGKVVNIDLPNANKMHYRYNKAEELDSLRDQLFNEAKQKLLCWKKSNSYSEWFDKQFSSIHTVKSKEKFASRIFKWGLDHRFSGDKEIFPIMDAWRKRERHLEQYSRNNVRSAIRYRQDAYKSLAAKLAKQYRFFKLENLNISSFGRKKAYDGNRGYRKAKTRLAPGEFKEALDRAMEKYGCEEILVNPAYTSKDCHDCGHRNTKLDSTTVWQVCERCGAEWDRDVNAARNIMFSVDESRAQRGPLAKRCVSK